MRRALFVTGSRGFPPERRAIERYVQLTWWAQVLNGVVQLVIQNLASSQDLGRTLRAEVELVGSRTEPEPRVLRLRLRADTGAGSADPVLAEAKQLDVAAYGSVRRPVITCEWSVDQAPGAQGVYVELDEMRLTIVADDAAADRLLMTELSQLAPLMAGRAHYDRHYATHAGEMGSLRIRRWGGTGRGQNAC